MEYEYEHWRAGNVRVWQVRIDTHLRKHLGCEPLTCSTLTSMIASRDRADDPDPQPWICPDCGTEVDRYTRRHKEDAVP